ncbi:MAG: hypothetical protein K0U54_00860 [Bacteroidetes bacterium]|nr:hypothetical protein [Bacteroidota bacterium]
MKLKKYMQKAITISLCLSILCLSEVIGQVGINTTDPQGALDINSSSFGMVYPRVALTSSVTAAPVTQPDGSAIVAGTVIYNTSNTSLGSNDVSPGLHVWDGTKWLHQFLKEEYQKIEQTGGCQRTTIRESYSNPTPLDADNIAGITAQTFDPKFSGRYKVEVKTNFAGGEIDPFTSSSPISLATTEGGFFFSMSGSGVDIDPTSSVFDYTEGWIYTHSYSSHNTIESPNIQNQEVEHFGVLVYYLYLMENSTYTFTLSNCINTGHAYFLNNGDSGAGQGHIGHDIPCSVEFTYLGD